ncbi:MAG: M15 family metallopeptidase [Nannocystaceae bacterium]|nr:M15 family metallopeptidase [Myxococcales bacterium]
MFDREALAQELDRRVGGPTSFGHLFYNEAPQATLVMLPNKQQMRVPAARAFLEMAIAAHREEGVNLLPAWVFRSHAFQRDLFLKWAARASRGFEENVRHVAPTGYSEHHTGYGVDIHDGPGPRQVPGAPFEQRPAYAWLTARAADFDFENSFPKDNVQGVTFEPWHWRWVGDAHACETFRVVRQLVAAAVADPRVGAAFRRGGEGGVPPDAPADVRSLLTGLLEEHAEFLEDERARGG